VTKAYIIAQATVADPARYEEYKRLAQAAVEAYGARYLVRGGRVEHLEGDWRPPRLVILEFDSMVQARRFYDSPEYRAARQARENVAAMNMLAVEGL
jgi:uncharacterized protein (DUF1330 family)